MLGTWELTAVGRPGPHLTLTIDSAGVERFRGRIAHAVSGNVVLDPERFAPFSGSVAPDGTFHLATAAGEPGHEIRITGHLAGDQWEITELVWAGEQLTADGPWVARRVTSSSSLDRERVAVQAPERVRPRRHLQETGLIAARLPGVRHDHLRHRTRGESSHDRDRDPQIA